MALNITEQEEYIDKPEEVDAFTCESDVDCADTDECQSDDCGDTQRKITKDDLTGPLKGKELSDLISLISKGNAYANIQTEKYPMGSIRAQIASSETGATSNETLTPTGNATNATTTTNETTSAVTPPPTMEQPPAVDMSATNATTTTNETTSAVTPSPTMEQPPAVDMSATNATTTTNETTGTTSEASTFPANQSTSAPNLDVDESMR